jgi:hypothetical protein
MLFQPLAQIMLSFPVKIEVICITAEHSQRAENEGFEGRLSLA